MSAVTYARFSPRRGGWRVESWWAKALLRAVEESAYDEGQLDGGRALARSGRIGGLIVEPGRVTSSVDEERGLWTTRISLPVLDEQALRALVEVLDSSPNRVDALLGGELPHDLVEYADELGAELLPYGEELSSVCTCDHWHDVCVHAVGVLHQVAWLADRDPLVLFHLRGLPREVLVAAVRHPEPEPPEPADHPAHAEIDEVEVALDAALRAQRLLDDAE